MDDPVKDAAAKERIITHMNGDHHDSVGNSAHTVFGQLIHALIPEPKGGPLS